jgi:carbamoyl-phosphate synthase large subunit
MGFQVMATDGTSAKLAEHGIASTLVAKEHVGSTDGRKTTVQAIMDGDLALVVNTPYGTGARRDGYEIRVAAVLANIPAITTVQGLAAAVEGIASLQAGPMKVKSIQEHVAELNNLLAGEPLKVNKV